MAQPEAGVDAPEAAATPAAPAETATVPNVAADATPTAPTEAPAADPASAPDTLAALADEARNPGTAPEAGDVAASPSAPQTDTGTVQIGAADTAVARPTAPGLLQPGPDADSSASQPTAPAQPSEIASTSPDLGTPAVPGTDVDAPQATPAEPSALAQPAAPDSGAVTQPQPPQVAGGSAPVTAETGVAAPAAPNAGQAPVDPNIAEAPLPAPRPALPASVGSDGVPTTEGPADPPAPQVTALVQPRDTGTEGAPSIGQPAKRLVPSSSPRLPNISGTEAETPAAVVAPSGDTRPVARFAEPIEVAADRPLMSIVLIDGGQSPIGPDVLDGFPYPVTVAIDPTAPDATDRAAAYREIGLEVMVLGRLPQGAVPQDVEVAIQAALTTIPEAVGVLESGDGGLQTSSAASDQISSILAQTGHGLVLFPKGLNAAASLASKAGVPAATVFRDFDGNGQDPKVMRRFLDQAAFKARQEDGVVMVGRMQADTISALLLWGLQDRAAQVALVPVSMVLR